MIIKASGLGKKFQKDWIFRNFDYQFEANKTYAITGPNGSGKSTLIKVLSGMMPATEGEIGYDNGTAIQEEEFYKHLCIAAPYLELEDGTCISQCTAITEYIDHQYEGPSLCGETAKERAVIHMMNLRAESGLLNAVGDYFHHATPGLGPELETNQNAEWGNRRKEVALQTMHYLDSVLEQQDYLAGGTFSMADVTAFAGLAFADFAKIDIPDQLGHLKAWREKVASRPSISN